MQDHHRYATLNKSLFDPFIPSPSFTFLSAGEFSFINFYFQPASTMGYSSKKPYLWLYIWHYHIAQKQLQGRNECFPEVAMPIIFFVHDFLF